MKKILPPNAILIPDNATRVFEGKIFDVYQWPQKMFDGSTATFEMLKRPDTVQIVAVRDGKLVMVDDEQPNRPAQIHFPGGRVDPEDTSWLSAAQRETAEETGMTFKTWKLIAVYQSAMKIEQFVPWFLTTDFVSEQPLKLDSGEKITVQPMSFEEVKARIVSQKDSTLNYALPLFMHLNSLDELLALPEFVGREVDR